MPIDWSKTYAAIWRQYSQSLRSVHNRDQVTLDSLIGIDQQKDQLIRNTEKFLQYQPANNVLLWGSRGTGKSSLVKALLNTYAHQGLRLIEVDKNDLVYLPEIVDHIRELPQRFIIYCDDLSFDSVETTYKHLKSVLEGSIELPPENVLVYATSNRRHLLPESMQDNQESQIVNGEIHYTDAVEEKLSLADRFGLWLSFYPFSMDSYLAIVDSYFPDPVEDRKKLHEAARHFALARASRSGRTARQFYNARQNCGTKTDSQE